MFTSARYPNKNDALFLCGILLSCKKLRKWQHFLGHTVVSLRAVSQYKVNVSSIGIIEIKNILINSCKACWLQVLNHGWISLKTFSMQRRIKYKHKSGLTRLSGGSNKCQHILFLLNLNCSIQR